MSHQMSHPALRLTRGLRLRRVLLLVAATTLIAGAIPALAQACTVANTTTTQAFKQFGDTASYTLAPSGSFESGTTGWSLGGASVKGGSESYFVNSTSDSRSLVVPATSQPISPPFCVNRSMPTFRFFARQVESAAVGVSVDARSSHSEGAPRRPSVLPTHSRSPAAVPPRDQ